MHNSFTTRSLCSVCAKPMLSSLFDTSLKLMPLKRLIISPSKPSLVNISKYCPYTGAMALMRDATV